MYPAQIDLVDDVLTFQRAQSLFFQLLEGDLVGCGVNLAIDFVAPGQSLSVEVCQRVLLNPNHEIILYKLYRAFHFP